MAWYAVNDPDPAATSGPDTQSPDRESVRMDGINSTRGAISQAVAHVLFDEPERFDRLHDAAYSLTHDRSIAVRSCAVDVILAVLNIQAEKAISWFRDSAVEDPRILAAPYVERFIHFAGYRDYPALRPVIDAMLNSATTSVVEVAARQVCVLALSVEVAEVHADLVRRGTPTMRKAAAKIYAANVADDAAGRTCRELVKSFFTDPGDAVRAEAASAFLNLAGLETSDQSDLLAAFLEAAPGPTALKTVVRALEESPVQLPDLVCRLAEMCTAAYRDEAGDISTESSMVAMDLSKIVVRLYAQTEDPMIQSRCLDLIDEMERHNFVGLSDELRKMDR